MRDEVAWWMAMVYLKSNELEKCFIALDSISKQTSRYSGGASELILVIKQRQRQG